MDLFLSTKRFNSDSGPKKPLMSTSEKKTPSPVEEKAQTPEEIEEKKDPVLCEIEKKIESANDFDYMNGDQFTDNSTVKELQTTLVEPSVVDDNTSTKSSSIDLNSPTVHDITECERREGNFKVLHSF